MPLRPNLSGSSPMCGQFGEELAQIRPISAPGLSIRWTALQLYRSASVLNWHRSLGHRWTTVQTFSAIRFTALQLAPIPGAEHGPALALVDRPDKPRLCSLQGAQPRRDIRGDTAARLAAIDRLRLSKFGVIAHYDKRSDLDHECG